MSKQILGYTVADAAQMTGISIWTIRKRMKARGIGSRFGREWVLTPLDVQALKAPGVRGNPDLIKRAK